MASTTGINPHTSVTSPTLTRHQVGSHMSKTLPSLVTISPLTCVFGPLLPPLKLSTPSTCPPCVPSASRPARRQPADHRETLLPSHRETNLPPPVVPVDCRPVGAVWTPFLRRRTTVAAVDAAAAASTRRRRRRRRAEASGNRRPRTTDRRRGRRRRRGGGVGSDLWRPGMLGTPPPRPQRVTSLAAKPRRCTGLVKLLAQVTIHPTLLSSVVQQLLCLFYGVTAYTAYKIEMTFVRWMCNKTE